MQLSFFSKLSPREKYYLIIGLVTTTGLFIYYFLWTPLAMSNQSLHQQVNQQKELLHWMQAQQIEIEQYAGQQQPLIQTQEPLFTIIESSLRTHMLDQLAIQLSSRDANNVLIQIDQIEFDKLIGWLTKLHTENLIMINQVNIHHIKEEMGYVQASVALRRIDPGIL